MFGLPRLSEDREECDKNRMLGIINIILEESLKDYFLPHIWFECMKITKVKSYIVAGTLGEKPEVKNVMMRGALRCLLLYLWGDISQIQEMPFPYRLKDMQDLFNDSKVKWVIQNMTNVEYFELLKQTTNFTVDEKYTARLIPMQLANATKFIHLWKVPDVIINENEDLL